MTAARAAEAIRAHWTIENTSHHTRGLTMGEDASRIRCNLGVFARLRSFGYNILKANRTGTLAQDRYRAGAVARSPQQTQRPPNSRTRVTSGLTGGNSIRS